MNSNRGLIALSIGAFAIGVTEFAPMGLLPVIANDLRVSIPTAGLLVSAYALGVVIAAPIMTLTTGRMSRRRLLIALMGIFTLGNALAALSDSYGMLLAARIVTASCHGAFFGVGSIVAASLVSTERKAAAVAAMFMGLTIANVSGVPLSSWVGEQLGWRIPFAGVTALGVLTMAALRFLLPAGAAPPRTSLTDELRVLTRRQVLTALLLTVIGSSAMFTVFTYIAPILRGETHASVGFITAMLVTYGVGLTVGNWLGGKYADRSVDRTLAVTLSALALLLVAFALLMSSAAATALLIFLWGVASFALVPPLQIRVMSAASEAPSLASAVNIGAFNLGNAIGAAIGGAVLAVGLGYRAVALAGAIMATLGLAIVVAQRRPRSASHQLPRHPDLRECP